MSTGNSLRFCIGSLFGRVCHMPVPTKSNGREVVDQDLTIYV